MVIKEIDTWLEKVATNLTDARVAAPSGCVVPSVTPACSIHVDGNQADEILLPMIESELL